MHVNEDVLLVTTLAVMSAGCFVNSHDSKEPWSLIIITQEWHPRSLLYEVSGVCPK